MTHGVPDESDLTTDEGERVDPVTGEILGRPGSEVVVIPGEVVYDEPPAAPEPEPPAAPKPELPTGWSPEVEAEVVERYRAAGSTFDLDEALKHAEQMRGRPQDRAIEAWWAWGAEYQRASFEAARARSEFERLEAGIVFRLRQQGEKSAEVAKMRALLVDEVWRAQLGYRLAEARANAADKQMRRLSAKLDDLRTQEANRRAMDSHTAWGQPS